MKARCQICGLKDYHWTVQQAEIHVGTIQRYKIQACPDCTKRIEDALIPVLALRHRLSEGSPAAQDQGSSTP